VNVLDRHMHDLYNLFMFMLVKGFEEPASLAVALRPVC
jgi:hypothetical protein